MKVERELRDPHLRWGVGLLLVCLPTALILPHRIGSGLLVGALTALGNFLVIARLVRRRIGANPRRRSGLILSILLMGKTAAVILVLGAVTAFGWVQPLGLFAGWVSMIAILTVSSLRIPVGETA